MSNSSKNRRLIDELRYFVLDEQSEARNAIIDYVKNNIENKERSIAMCFRGDYMCLYYRCHMLLMIKVYGKKIVGEFNFRHSRFTNDYDIKEKRLRSLGVVNFNERKYIDENGEEKCYSFDSKQIRFDIAKLNKDGEKWTCADLIKRTDFEEIFDIFKNLIEDFVNPEKNIYCWQGEKDKPKVNEIANKPRNIEKNAQQKLYAQYFNCAQAFIYDLEYTEHGISKKEAELLASKELEKIKTHGRFDLLGIVHEEGGDVLEFIELKSTLSACNEKTSGVRSHIKDYMKYLENDERVKARMAEALDTIAILKTIFRIPFTPQPIKTRVRARVRFIFTDEAEKYDFPIAVTKYSQL